MAMPLALIARAAGIQGERDAEARLLVLQDISLATGLKLGQSYVDPKNPGGRPKRGEAFYSLEKFNDHVEHVEKLARPWLHTPAARKARREAEEERRMDAFERALRAK
ncbi:hypothetical protein GO986_09040 [Deinococcus sp. HMF7620]|uniref:Uncharacterized protein n=2 Tax=Deinococcus arboris TaxID=2682977 RepID=A0A7C9HRF0_9DEIO|nr:hypothetical protein [Deinococcus arboris]